jgi:hypothetical protein
MVLVPAIRTSPAAMTTRTAVRRALLIYVLASQGWSEGGRRRLEGQTPFSMPGSFVRHFPTQRRKIDRPWAVHHESPPLEGMAWSVPAVAHINPLPTLGLVLREQRQ